MSSTYIRGSCLSWSSGLCSPAKGTKKWERESQPARHKTKPTGTGSIHTQHATATGVLARIFQAQHATVAVSDERDDVLSFSASSLRPEGMSVSSSGLDMSVQSRSLSTSGREETPGADQARRLTPSTEADWGGRSLGGPGGAGARPFGGGRRCSKHASGAQ